MMFQAAEFSGIATYDDRDKCTMNNEIRNKIKAYHKQYRPPPRGDFDGPYYECLLEDDAKQKLENSSYKLERGYDTIRVKLHKDKGKSIEEKLEKAFKLPKWNKLKEASYPVPNLYGCFYNDTLLLCVYNKKLVLPNELSIVHVRSLKILQDQEVRKPDTLLRLGKIVSTLASTLYQHRQ
ncbi:hypothetical protein Y032_0387g464 [Ancylostoma ceylanicum]|uniref:Uncharacterized protein n=1 Tax=Ancylostoma ceylanicum TaxID=53326 RepID=A0A016RTI6_9BILA|nr:hypothetical protein Y032_0387g464 [Ancylostoma ceylanicum]